LAGTSPDGHHPDLQGWASDHPAFEEAIAGLRPRVVVEVGVWKGAATIHMAKLLRKYGVDGFVIAVDTWLGSSEHWTNDRWFPDLRVEKGYPSLYRTFVNNVVSAGVGREVVPLPLDSRNAAVVVKALGIVPDLIHIDAGHDFDSVTADLATWWHLLRPGGCLIGDDYFHRGKPWPGVKAAFDAFVKAEGLTPAISEPKIRLSKPGPPPAPVIPQTD
jgi:hypothetical protein